MKIPSTFLIRYSATWQQEAASQRLTIIIRAPENEIHSLNGSTTNEKKTAKIEKYPGMRQKPLLQDITYWFPKNPEDLFPQFFSDYENLIHLNQTLLMVVVLDYPAFVIV